MSDININRPEQIERARWLSVRSALSLEIKGIKRSKGKSARQLANEITGQEHRTAREAYAALDQYITEKMGRSFARPLS